MMNKHFFNNGDDFSGWYVPGVSGGASIDCDFESLMASDWTVRSLSESKRQLWKSFWYEGETAILFADTNLGKSILAVQIAEAVAQTGTKVLYVDFELTGKQFGLRYSDESGYMYRFSPNLFRAQLRDGRARSLPLHLMLHNMDKAVNESGAKVLIIDNITWICASDTNADNAGMLMQTLASFRQRYGLSMLLLAHTPKRDAWKPLDANSLAGSKRLANFADSIFAIGECRSSDEGRRYIKQIKTRNSHREYGASNVLTAYIEKQNAFLGFTFTGTATEEELLADPAELELDSSIRRLNGEGRTVTQIARELKCSPGRVKRVVSA